jgi:putative acetyltransferase
MRIREATSENDLREVKRLFLAYEKSLGISLCFQNFEQEVASLPGAYAPPRGCLLLAEMDDGFGGCVAVRALQGRTCEMKRLYVEPAFRGTGAGRGLVMAAMDMAKVLGYSAMRLDTLPSMTNAVKLYFSFGFEPIEAYYNNPVPGALFLECKL